VTQENLVAGSRLASSRTSGLVRMASRSIQSTNQRVSHRGDSIQFALYWCFGGSTVLCFFTTLDKWEVFFCPQQPNVPLSWLDGSTAPLNIVQRPKKWGNILPDGPFFCCPLLPFIVLLFSIFFNDYWVAGEISHCDVRLFTTEIHSCSLTKCLNFLC
jgi:hypothetical protein